MVKLLTILGITVIVFASCGTLTPQETQQERLRLIEAYNAAREKHNPEKVKETVKELLIGKWQYVSLEVEESSVTAKQTTPRVQQGINSLNAFVKRVSEGAASQQTTTSAAPEQTESPNSRDPEAGEQTSTENATRLPRIEVTDEKSSQQILSAKAALVASTRQNLTVEFAEARGSYHYSGSNGGKRVTGQCYITTQRYGDDIFPYVRFNQRTGPEMLEFLFGSESVKRIAAKQKQKRAAMLQSRKMGIQGARRAAAKKASFSIASLAGITVTGDTLSLVLYGDMKLTPKGWMRTGGLRCTFKRIESE